MIGQRPDVDQKKKRGWRLTNKKRHWMMTIIKKRLDVILNPVSRRISAPHCSFWVSSSVLVFQWAKPVYYRKKIFSYLTVVKSIALVYAILRCTSISWFEVAVLVSNAYFFLAAPKTVLSFSTQNTETMKFEKKNVSTLGSSQKRNKQGIIQSNSLPFWHQRLIKGHIFEERPRNLVLKEL